MLVFHLEAKSLIATESSTVSKVVDKPFKASSIRCFDPLVISTLSIDCKSAFNSSIEVAFSSFLIVTSFAYLSPLTSYVLIVNESLVKSIVENVGIGLLERSAK